MKEQFTTKSFFEKGEPLPFEPLPNDIYKSTPPCSTDNKLKLFYVINGHSVGDRLEKNTAIHERMIKELGLPEFFDIEIVINSTEQYGNWGGPIGLVDRWLETNPRLPNDSYIFSTEDDCRLRYIDFLFKGINFLEGLSRDYNLSHFGYVNTPSNTETFEIKDKKLLYKVFDGLIVTPGFLDRITEPKDPHNPFGKYSAWTDGGSYLFKTEKLLEIKNKLKVLPGYATEQGGDCPLDESLRLHYTQPTHGVGDMISRIVHHEIGWCTRLKYHGYDFSGDWMWNSVTNEKMWEIRHGEQWTTPQGEEIK